MRGARHRFFGTRRADVAASQPRARRRRLARHDWITPSAINSWIGEEVRPVALEGTVAASAGSTSSTPRPRYRRERHGSGTLLTFRGWALHDRTTLAFRRQPLPPLDGEIGEYQAPFTHPLIDLHSGFAHRPGYYAKLAWQPPVPVRVELFRYDNRANPEDVNADLEWGWRTRFNHVGAGRRPRGGRRAQGAGDAGTHADGLCGWPARRWVDTRFRSAFVLLSRPFGRFGLAARVEAFDTRNRGSGDRRRI